MSSSVHSILRIAANRLLTIDGTVIDRPLAELSPEGRIRSVVRCEEADRQPFTIFLAGLLVPDFPRDFRAAFAAVAGDRTTPLDRLLPRERGGICVLLTGIDYRRMLLTERSRIRAVTEAAKG